MDFIIYYIEIGIIANVLLTCVSLFVVIYTFYKMGFIEISKYSIYIKTKENNLKYLGIFIPFYWVYIGVIEIYFVFKYFDGSSNSLIHIFETVDKYRIVKGVI